MKENKVNLVKNRFEWNKKEKRKKNQKGIIFFFPFFSIFRVNNMAGLLSLVNYPIIVQIYFISMHIYTVHIVSLIVLFISHLTIYIYTEIIYIHLQNTCI